MFPANPVWVQDQPLPNLSSDDLDQLQQTHMFEVRVQPELMSQAWLTSFGRSCGQVHEGHYQGGMGT